MKTIAIIPARGGSKGIPSKNITPLGGKPLIVYSIEQALNAPSVDAVYVSTDDSEIAKVSEQHQASIIWRPDELSSDTATSESALQHAILHVEQENHDELALVVFLQATSPLRGEQDIQNAIDLLHQEEADSLFSASLIEGFIWSQEGQAVSAINYDPQHRPRRQDKQALTLEENGSIYLFKPWVLKKHQSRLGGKIVAYPMDPLHSFQVDTPEDLMRMEILLKLN